MKKYKLINSLEKFEQLFEIKYKDINRGSYSRQLFKHPLRFTNYLIAQIKKHPSIAKQYLPDPRELDNTGLEKPFQGIIDTDIHGLERMYLDRVAIMFTSQCFAYCRFCFRKNYSLKNDYCKPQNKFTEVINYIKKDPRIKEVLITGGDPLLFPDQLYKLIIQLKEIPHLTAIRLGTRIFTSDPELVTKDWIKPFQKLNKAVIASLTKQSLPNSHPTAPLSISPHINHPDELSPETIKSLLLCTQNNIPLYNQTVLLQDINDDPEILIVLFRKLRQLGVEPYRIYLADPTQGTNHFRTSIARFQEIHRYLRSHASGYIVPHFVIDTRIGKIELGADSEIIKREANTVYIKTPYTVDIYQSIDSEWQLPEYCSLHKDDSIIVEYEDK